MYTKARWLMAVAVFAVLICLYGLAEASASSQNPFAGQLVSIAIREKPSDPRRLSALKELRKMARDGQVSIDVLKPLAGDWPRDSLILEPLIACEALAACGPESEHTLVEKVKSGHLWLLQALAEVQEPTPAVNNELISLADREETFYGKSMYALALAARGDKSKDWKQELSQYITLHVPLSEEMQRSRFWLALAYVAPRLKDSAIIEDALWEVASAKDYVYGQGSALLAFSIMAHRPIDTERIEYLKALLQKDMHDVQFPGKVTIHLVLAHLGVSPDSEINNMLSLMGSHEGIYWGAEERGGAVILYDALIDESLRPAIRRAIASDCRPIKIAAIQCARILGPDAQDMLPDLMGLISDPDPAIVVIAIEAGKRVQGVMGLSGGALE